MNSKTLDTTISKGTQSVQYNELITVGGSVKHMIMLTIKSDSYRDQCVALAERWDGAKWQRVIDIPTSAMKTEISLVYLPNSTGMNAQHFTTDRNELLRLVGLVLGVTL